MCREKKFCEVLGTDSSKWDRQCLIRMPSFFEDAVENFSSAVSHLACGDKVKSLQALKKCNSESVGKFYIEHGKQSSYFRVNNWRKTRKNNSLLKKKNDTKKTPSASLNKEVFERDFYRCRYCGLRIITKEVFHEYGRLVGPVNFSTVRSEIIRNGLTLGLRGVADHVFPYSLGGKTQMDNLVTSCYSCNFGKWEYKLEQLDLEDPFSRQLKDDGWRGLTEFLPTLKKIKRLPNG